MVHLIFFTVMLISCASASREKYRSIVYQEKQNQQRNQDTRLHTFSDHSKILQDYLSASKHIKNYDSTLHMLTS